ncbi:hypothetical protein HYS31_05215, partial [Candidatus Woesearchaeota archaeon]|nr:hypothetical protein [Candidatus Woesearchaeota archaeon]
VVPKYDCYRADIIADAKIRSDYSSGYFPIRIRNSGIKPAAYGIALEGPSWISIEPEKLMVNPGQIGNANLKISPGHEVEEGTYPVKIHAKFEDIAYSKNIEVELSKNRFLKAFKSFFIFYQYYIYLILVIAALLLAFRRRIVNKIKSSYKNYRTKQARLKSLKAARKARELKKRLKQLEKAEIGVKTKKYAARKIFLFFAGFIIIVAILSFSVYRFDFPVSREFVKNYYPYFLAGILASIFIILLIEFYKPLFRLLRKIK